MSVERNVIITTGEEVVTPQKAERILAACTPARAKGQAIKAAKALEGFLRLQYERGQQARAEAKKANNFYFEIWNYTNTKSAPLTLSQSTRTR